MGTFITEVSHIVMEQGLLERKKECIYPNESIDYHSIYYYREYRDIYINIKIKDINI